MKSLIEYISEEDYPRFNALLAKAEEAKKNAPKPERKPRGPMTLDQKLKMAESRKNKAQALLDKLMAEQDGEDGE